MATSFKRRVCALERAMGASDGRLMGVVDLRAGQSPLDALADAGAGMWFLSDPQTDEGFLGEVRRNGKREVHHGNN